MSGRIIGYPQRIWVPLGPTTAAGYDRDPVRGWTLTGLLYYGPTTQALRGTRLRAIEQPPDLGHVGAIRQDDPPGPELVAAAWAARQGTKRGAAAMAEAAIAQAEAEFEPLRQQLRALNETVEEWAGPARRATEALRAQALAEVERATAPDMLRKRDGEPPDAFYARIAAAHAALAAVTDRPTTELAARAGVGKGTAASWVSRARSRGLYGHGTDDTGLGES